MSRPPRIQGFSYLGPHRYFLTFSTHSRRQVFIDASAVAQTLVHFRKTAEQKAFAILAYCLMPDHAHLLVEGTTHGSDLRRFVKLAKQRSGAAYSIKAGKPLWQEGYHDRALRKDQDLRDVARYILENPVRAALVPHAADYPYSGSDAWPISELLDSLR